MLLSELIKTNNCPKEVYGIQVDEDLLTPPEGLEKVALLYDGDESISETLIDAVIAFSLAGVEVIVEVQPGQNIDKKELLTIAGNAGFSLSILPPERQEDVPGWSQDCAEWAQTFLQVPNFTGSLFPVSGYFGYLTAKIATGIEAIIPNDTYVLERFVNSTPEEWSDSAKAEMYKAFCEMAGGEEEFNNFLKAFVASVVKTNVEILEEEHQRDTQTD